MWFVRIWRLLAEPLWPGAGAGPPDRLRAAPVLARLVLVLALAGFAAIQVDEMLSTSQPVRIQVVSVVSIVALVAVQVWFSARSAGPPVGRSAVPVLLGQAVLVSLPVLAGGPIWPGVPGFLVGSLLIALAGRAAVPLSLAVAVGAALLEQVPGSLPPHLPQSVLVAVSTLVFGVVVAGLTALLGLVQALLDARTELASAIAREERARLAQDVHDLLGLGLTAITLKCEVATRLLAVDVGLARQQLAEVLVVARRVLAEVRTVAQGLERLSLDDELELAQDTLVAVDVRTTVQHSDPPPTGSTGTVLAAAVREGVTNVLRHSDPTWCRIAVRQDRGRVQLEIENDGARPPTAGHRPGQGLRNVRARAAAMGGSVEHGPVGDGGHRLTVRLPRG
jgi:two-component system sensor histidine kinase DesK